MKRILVILLFLLSPLADAAVYQTPEEFLAEAFGANVPPVKRLWMKKPIGEQVRSILGRELGLLRVRYWKKGQRTAWILEEIGKEKPITTGLVVDDGSMQLLRVLEFREVRGHEIRHRFFTQQFAGLTLNDERQLSRQIDGITGATMSVTAMKKLARLALYLHRQVMES